MLIDTLKFFFNKFCYSLSGNFFAWVMTFRALITSSDAIFKYNKKSQDYTISSKKSSEGRVLKFKHELQGGQTYLKGIYYRGEEIGERYLLKNINFFPGDIIYDCGANLGDLLLWFQNRQLKISYRAFEPSPEEFQLLKQNVGKHDSEQVALWNQSKILDFYVSSQTADSSLIEPKNYNNILKIQAKRLDSFINKSIKLLKLEAEGGELEVLQGAGNKISKIHYISADLGPERGVSQESTLTPVTNFLKQKNFFLIDYNSSRFTALFQNGDSNL